MPTLFNKSLFEKLFSIDHRSGLLCVMGLFIGHMQLIAQGVVTGSVKDEEQRSIPFASIDILSQSDSSKVRSGFADDKGVFNLKNIPYGHYRLLISSVGFTALYTPVFELSMNKTGYEAGAVSLAKNASTLRAVVLTSKKPVLEKRPDRFVMNVSTSTYQSTDLLNIFKALPFMDVDGENITINGKANILVLVDNIPRPKETLISIFQSMTGQDIERIEFITNPSAQYDASADAVINIITKKGLTQGLTGYARAAFSQGIYANGNGGAGFTLRQKKLVLNGTFNLSGGTFMDQNYGYRVLALQNQQIVFNESPEDLFKMLTVSGSLAMEYALNANHHLGAQIDGNSRNMLNGTTWYNKIEFSDAIGGRPDSTLLALQHAHSKTNFLNYRVSYTGKLDSAGKKISAAFIYTPLDKLAVNEMQYQNIVDDKGDILEKLPVIRNTNPSHSRIVVAQMDAQLPFKDQWQINVGIKTNFSKLTSDPYQESLNPDNTWSLIPEYSFDNLYNERILAAYAGLQKGWGNFSLNAAVRGEKTRMSVQGVYERNFTDLFPSLQLQQKFSKDYSMSLSYKRSINRPSFMELTPYRTYLDNYTILIGNPELVPQYTDAINVNASIKGKLYVDLDYSSSKNSFSQLPRQIMDTTVWQVINYNAKYFSTTITYNYNFLPWWQGNVLLRGTYYKMEGYLGDQFISNDRLAALVGINNTFSLPSDLKLDVGFNYRSPRPFGLAVARERSFLRVALKGSLLQKRLQYTITAADIYKDDIGGFDLKTSNLQTRFYTFSDSRRLTIGFVYNFGKSTVKAASEKRLENEELLNRAN